MNLPGGCLKTACGAGSTRRHGLPRGERMASHVLGGIEESFEEIALYHQNLTAKIWKGRNKREQNWELFEVTTTCYVVSSTMPRQLL